MDEAQGTPDVQEILPEYTGLDNLVSKLKQIDYREVEHVSPSTLEGFIAFGTLMCRATKTDADESTVNELEGHWQRIAPALGKAGVARETPASAGAAG